MTPRLVLLTVTTILLSTTANAEYCRLQDGREFATNFMGDIVQPIELVGYRLRERDDLGGYEIFRPFSAHYDAFLVESCVPSFGGGGGDGGPEPVAYIKKRHHRVKDNQGSRDGGRDSGGRCERQGGDDDGCAER